MSFFRGWLFSPGFAFNDLAEALQTLDVERARAALGRMTDANKAAFKAALDKSCAEVGSDSKTHTSIFSKSGDSSVSFIAFLYDLGSQLLAEVTEDSFGTQLYPRLTKSGRSIRLDQAATIIFEILQIILPLCLLAEADLPELKAADSATSAGRATILRVLARIINPPVTPPRTPVVRPQIGGSPVVRPVAAPAGSLLAGPSFSLTSSGSAVLVSSLSQTFYPYAAACPLETRVPLLAEQTFAGVFAGGGSSPSPEGDGPSRDSYLPPTFGGSVSWRSK